MRVVSHRGNLRGPSSRANDPAALRECLDLGFQVELDLWFKEEGYWLGHDRPTYEVAEIKEWDMPDVIMHLKTPRLPSLRFADAFAIEEDPYVVTVRGFIWANYGTAASPQAIMCAPDLVGAEEPLEDFVRRIAGSCAICTDYPLAARGLIE